MCYIFQCFGWTLDIFQRGVTLILSCCIGCAVCVGLAVAIVAGVAYGYNYSLAEFMEATKPEVTVFVRRGHFYDEADLNPKARRRSGEDEDISNVFANKDYEDKGESEGAKPLTDSWVKAKDVKQYADKLNKFSSAGYSTPMAMMPTHTLPPVPSKLTTFLQPFRRVAVLEGVPTTIWKDGTTKIVLRKFDPTSNPTKMDLYKIDHELSQEKSGHNEVTIDADSFYDVPGELSKSKLISSTSTENPRSIDVQYEDTTAKEIRAANPKITSRPRRRWGAPAYTVNDEEQTNVVFDKVDEDNILYRAEENY